jgi:hypothetical protein
MGVEYKHYLIPKPNSFRPDPEQLTHFISSLAMNKWIPSSGASVRTSEGVGKAPFPISADWLRGVWDKDVLLSWPVESLAQAQLKYPLERLAWPAEETYYEFQIHWSRDYVYHVSELIDPFDDTRCKCGEELGYEEQAHIFYDGRLKLNCPRCGVAFEASDLPAVVRDGWTAEEREVSGGATYRFAVVVDCGKAIPDDDVNATIHPELRALCEQEFRRPFDEVGDFY